MGGGYILVTRDGIEIEDYSTKLKLCYVGVQRSHGSCNWRFIIILKPPPPTPTPPPTTIATEQTRKRLVWHVHNEDFSFSSYPIMRVRIDSDVNGVMASPACLLL